MAPADTASDQGLHAIAITDDVERYSRHLARIWSGIAVLVFVGLAVTTGLPRGPDLETWERAAQLVTLGVLVVATAVAWKWEGLGGSVMLIAATSLGVLATLQHQPLVAFLPALAFIIPAIGFLISWHRTRTYAAVVTLVTALAMVLVTGSLAAQAMYDHGFGAAHPQSSLPPLPKGPVVWMWSGGVTESSAVVVAEVETTETVSLTLTSDDAEQRAYPGDRRNDVWRFEMNDLAPLTDYTYHLVIEGLPHTERSGHFRTFSTGPMDATVAVGSCSRLGSNGKVYETILATDPDLFLTPGDFYYADHIEVMQQFAAAFHETLTQPAQAGLLGSVPIAYVWDDHDFGGNDSDSLSPIRDIARDAYSTYVPHYPLTGSGTINQAFTIGRVRFVMLDNRSARDPSSKPDGPDKTMLGADQLSWLEDELRAAADQYPLIVLVTSVPWVAAPEAGADHWGGYATERAQIADLIASHEIHGLLMVAGDAHMVAIDDGSNTQFSAVGKTSFPLLHAAALDRPGSVKGGPYSEGVSPGGGQFATIEIHDTGSDEIAVALTGLDWTGATLVEYTFVVDVSEVGR